MTAIMQNDKIDLSAGESQSPVRSCQVSPRLSFGEALKKAKSQINMECFTSAERGLAGEIVMNMAEVYMLYDSAPVKIAGDALDGYIVKQVFEMVSEDHVRLVMENYEKIKYSVTFKKSYLRTALYNAVFELEAHYANLAARSGY